MPDTDPGRRTRARSFGAAAASYEAGRPEYPAEAVAWLLEPAYTLSPSPEVVDVGAGTGKLTRIVRGLGARVSAVDPDPKMLDALRRSSPDVPTLEGAAEALPLPDASADALVFGQSWHWVDPPAGSREAARVLRAGGVLGLVWNLRDEREPWVRELTAAMHPSTAEEMLAEGGPTLAAPFGILEARSWEWTQEVTRDDLFALVGSRSYVLTASPEEREGIESAVGRLCDRIGAVGDRRVTLPYVTRAFRAVRP